WHGASSCEHGIAALPRLGGVTKRYRYPRLRAARHARIVRPVARAVVPAGRSVGPVGPSVVREEGPEPEQEVAVVIPVEVVMPVEVVVPVEAMGHTGPALVTAREAVTAPETVTPHSPHSPRLAGRPNRKHDRQGGERHN